MIHHFLPYALRTIALFLLIENELLPNPINHSTQVSQFWLQLRKNTQPYLDMLPYFFCVLLKIEKLVIVEALIGFGIKTCTHAIKCR
jgi:hypothetical protein